MALLKATGILSGKATEPRGGLTFEQFRAAVAADKLKPPKLCGHKGCTKPLGPRFGEHNKIDGKPVCEDCYFDELGSELEKFPIGRLGIRRR